jgi:hypothetical protein
MQLYVIVIKKSTTIGHTLVSSSTKFLTSGYAGLCLATAYKTKTL